MSDQVVERLIAHKQNIWAEIKAHVDEVEKNTRGWTAEDTAKHESMQEEYDLVKERADELHAAAEAQADIDAQRGRVRRSRPFAALSEKCRRR